MAIYVVEMGIRPNTIYKLEKDVLEEWNPHIILSLVREQWSVEGKVIID
jgi:hypothetical protein